MTIEIAPSVLAADFGRLREQVEEVREAGAQVIHIDVMDGHFVPPLSMGPPVCRALRDIGLHLEVHLMVERPERQVESFAQAGADTIIVHAEATPNVHYALQAVREAVFELRRELAQAVPERTAAAGIARGLFGEASACQHWRNCRSARTLEGCSGMAC